MYGLPMVHNHRPYATVITRPDKGNCVVILNRSDYMNKTLYILEGSSKSYNPLMR